MYKRHTHCRACGTELPTLPVFSLDVQPLANDFRKPGEECAGMAPLEVLLCPKCYLGQLSVVVNPHVLYLNYKYVTSPSTTMRQHFARLMSDIKEHQQCTSRIMEIGSNDGAFLKWAIDHHHCSEVLGVDPAVNLGIEACRSGVKTVSTLFTGAFGESCMFQPDVILARHVFCHVDDWKDFVTGLEGVALPNTLICIEVPYCGSMLRNSEWDTVYHEHTSYLTIRSVLALLDGTNLMLWKVVHYPIHGGAILLMLRRRDGPYSTSSEVAKMAAEEIEFPSEWRGFSSVAHNNIMSFTEYIHTHPDEMFAGVGASAKSTVWVNACRLDNNKIEYISDTTEHKQGCLSPGSDIPIVPEKQLFDFPPDVAVCFAWNFRDECLRKLQPLREQGMRVLFPVPSIDVV